MNRRGQLILAGSALLLSACAAPSQSALTNASAACGYGNKVACAQVPGLNAQVQQENVNNQVGAALIGGAVLGGALAAPYGYNGYNGYYYGRPYGYNRYYGRPYGWGW